MDNYIKQAKNEEVETWIDTTLRKYTIKHGKDVTRDEHIIDFLNSEAAPKRLGKMSVAQAKKSAEKWTAALVKKGKHLTDAYGDVRVVKRVGGFKLVRLITESAYIREGTLMGHCVGSYFGKKNSVVYSLRDNANMPHCTIEVITDGQDSIQQVKGKGNGAISPKYVKAIVSVLKNFFKLPIRSDEMKHLGYVKPSSDLMKYIKAKKIRVKQVKLSGVSYVVK